jgi:hypothetical protein
MSEVIGTLAGIVVGALISSIAFWYKRRIDTLSTLQVSLYRLLELYRSIWLSILPSHDVQLDWYIEVAHEIFPEENLLEKKNEVKEFLLPIVSAASCNISQENEDEGLLVSYTETISKLGPVAPLLAYRLSANTSLKKALGEMDRYHKNVKSHIKTNASEKDIATFDAVISIVQSRTSKEVIGELRRDILWLAFRCGVIPLLALLYRFYIRREESIESILKREYRAILLEIRAKGHDVPSTQ